jgi:hypothetical protein
MSIFRLRTFSARTRGIPETKLSFLKLVFEELLFGHCMYFLYYSY